MSGIAYIMISDSEWDELRLKTQKLEEENKHLKDTVFDIGVSFVEQVHQISELKKEKNELYEELNRGHTLPLKNILLQQHIDDLNEQVERLKEENSALNHDYEVCQLKRDMYAQRLNELNAQIGAVCPYRRRVYGLT